jgi:GTP-binding protein YchF
MGFNCGIVGLPNVGKSTLFNALVRTAAAAAANYPFCTIEPNIGRVPVPDERHDTVGRIARSARIVPTQLEVMDIAGLVRGASRGEGLGNRFLGAIREVDAILQVLRCFEDDDIAHVEGGVDPVRDAELIETELLLADIASLERRIDGLTKRVRGADTDARRQLALIEQIRPDLEAGTQARRLRLDAEQAATLRELQLLTAKPVLYLCNVDEASAATGNAWSAAVSRWADEQGAPSVVIAAAIEAEIAALADDERAEYLAAVGLERPGLGRLIQSGCGLLELITFLTAGPKGGRAWPLRGGTTAAEAAGTIHSDFQRGFNCAEVVRYQEFLRCDGEAGARDAGQLRQEGRDYVVQDGDVVHFRFNV